VLTVLAALAFGFVCFLGANFLNVGQEKVWGQPHTFGCVLIAVVIAVLLGGTAYGAKFLKRTSRNFKTCFVWEMILLVLFVGLAFFFANSPFPHYFVVSDQKTEIQSKLTSSITQAENMFAEYERHAEEREYRYGNKLRSVVAAKSTSPSEYIRYGFDNNGVPDERQIENKMFTIHADLFPSNFAEMKQGDSTWLSKAKKTVEYWKPIGVVSVVKDVEQNAKNWLNELIQLSAIRENGEEQAVTGDFSYELTFDDVKNYFTTFGIPTPLSIGLAVLAYLLMLLSWFVTKRHTRFPGLKVLFGFGKTSNNEL